MAAPIFYVEDTCALRSDPAKTGQVDRTFSDVGTHHPDPLHTYSNGIDHSKRISRSTFRQFLTTGVPPRRTVVVTWTSLPWQLDLESTLIYESELILTDRCLIVGDVVKKNVEDTLSGTVILTSTSVTLLQPQPWPRGNASTSSTAEPKFGNYSADKENLLQHVSTDDLVPAKRWNVDDFIIYKNWVGKIDSVWEEIYIRLSNGSVVVIDDPNEVEAEYTSESLSVGDYVKTKKGNLRRGRWIYGAFDPAIEPAGYIADIRVPTLEVDWLCSRFPAWNGAPSEEPPFDIDQDLLDSGEIQLYDRRCLPHVVKVNNDVGLEANTSDQTEIPVDQPPGLTRLDLDLCVGSTVRFRDIAGAAVKYNGDHISEDGLKRVKMNRVSRMDASGFDINVFQVVQTNTIATVLWQDLTISVLPSMTVIPYIDMGEDDEVWPGELIATKPNASSDDIFYRPEKVGIVQSVNARDRMAQVKWFIEGYLLFSTDEEPILMPGSSTGQLSETCEAVSLYDVDTLPGLSRRLGDYIVVQYDASVPQIDSSPLRRRVAALTESTESKDWFGEVVELGLDGLLTVRLGASSHVRDVRIPWECTYLVYSSDFEDDEHDDDDDYDMDTDEDDDMEDDDDTNSTMSELVQIRGSDGVWRDVDEMEDVEDWTTDDEDDDADDDDKLNNKVDELSEDDIEMTDIHTDHISEKKRTDASHNLTQTPVASFSYGNLFGGIKSMATPELSEETATLIDLPSAFSILESQPPRDHHYSSRVAHHNNHQLKRIQKEYKILQHSLPDGVYVRTWESALDLIRVLILGPVGTPYEFAPFVIDFHLDQYFPVQPPQAFFHSWTNGSGPINPNLYEDGKICLSLLGTWPGDEKNETWSPTNSTIMQVIVSLLGLVLVNEPFYNEAGYEARAGTIEARIPSAIYSERTYFKARGFITHALSNPVSAFEQDIKAIYVDNGAQEGPQLLKHATLDAIEVIRRSMEKEGTAVTGRTVSVGALIPLRRQVFEMIETLRTWNKEAAEHLEWTLKSLTSQ